MLCDCERFFRLQTCLMDAVHVSEPFFHALASAVSQPPSLQLPKLIRGHRPLCSSVEEGGAVSSVTPAAGIDPDTMPIALPAPASLIPEKFNNSTDKVDQDTFKKTGHETERSELNSEVVIDLKLDARTAATIVPTEPDPATVLDPAKLLGKRYKDLCCRSTYLQASGRSGSYKVNAAGGNMGSELEPKTEDRSGGWKNTGMQAELDMQHATVKVDMLDHSGWIPPGW